MTDHEFAPRWSITLGVVFAAALPGLLFFAAVRPLADKFDVEAGLVEYAAHGLFWHVVVFAMLLFALPRIEQRRFRDLVSRWWTLGQSGRRASRPVLLWLATAIAALIAFSPVRFALIDAGWDVLPGPDWSINSPDANRGTLGFTISTAVLILQLVVRIPLTVFVEETLFRGWVLERHGPIASALLFAAYHLSQWWTIPALVPFGLALALLRLAARSIWPGAIAHWVGNAMYAFSLR